MGTQKSGGTVEKGSASTSQCQPPSTSCAGSLERPCCPGQPPTFATNPLACSSAPMEMEKGEVAPAAVTTPWLPDEVSCSPNQLPPGSMVSVGGAAITV